MAKKNLFKSIFRIFLVFLMIVIPIIAIRFVFKSNLEFMLITGEFLIILIITSIYASRPSKRKKDKSTFEFSDSTIDFSRFWNKRDRKAE